MASEFDKNINISYVEENIAPPDNKLILKHYLCSFFMYLLIYFILANNPFFKTYFNGILRHIYLWALLAYLVFSPVIYCLFRPKTIYKSHSIEIYSYFTRIFKSIFSKDTILKQDYRSILNNFVPSYNEKQALMLIFIKVFFGTLMAKFFYDDIISINNNLLIAKNIFSSSNLYFGFDYIKELIVENGEFLYRFGVLLLFSVDVLVFCFGYFTELSIFKNKIRTVDTSFLGIFFCLMCYPPFNRATTSFLGWNQNDNAMLFNDETSAAAWSIRLIALIFLFIYVSASVALGTRASNLTNRGIVSSFPYNIVRHPAYISKNIFWFLTTIPLIIVDLDIIDISLRQHIMNSLLILCSTFFWMFVYYMRAITEERHLMQDPDYQKYCEKVKWRFIPYII